tara:strand:+ start:1095 stop:1262 length:168 start_codon:yes stop_codon:yes gene_type:complete
MNKNKSVAPIWFWVAFMVIIGILELMLLHQQEDRQKPQDVINEKYLKFKMKEPVE